MRREYYYLDTNYLLAYLAHWNQDISKSFDIKDGLFTANSVIKNLNTKKIKVPLPVLAELVMQLKEKNVNIGTLELCGDFEIAMLKRNEIINFIRALILLVEDERLEVMDSIIVAHAISSSECKGLLTFDKKLILSKTIKDVDQEINGSRGIIITDDPRKR
jgi:predicted nucleic acid-binding protein